MSCPAESPTCPSSLTITPRPFQAAAPFSVLPFQVAKLSDSVTNLVGYLVTDQNGDGVVSAGDSVKITGAQARPPPAGRWPCST